MQVSECNLLQLSGNASVLLQEASISYQLTHVCHVRVSSVSNVCALKWDNVIRPNVFYHTINKLHLHSPLFYNKRQDYEVHSKPIILFSVTLFYFLKLLYFC